jgi:hypothetical protein
MAKEVQIDIVIKAADAANSLKDIKTNLKAVNDEILKSKEGSAEFNRLTTAAGKLKDKVNDLNDSLKLAQGSGFERLTASLGTIKEGITNVDFDKFKTGIKGATTSFDGLGSAIKATGIGLLVMVIVQIIANFDKLAAVGGVVGIVFTAIGDAIKFIIQGLKDFGDWLGITSFKTAEAAEAEKKYGDSIRDTNRQIGEERRKQLVATGKLSEEQAQRENAREVFITEFIKLQLETRAKLKEDDTEAGRAKILEESKAKETLLAEQFKSELISARKSEEDKKNVKVEGTKSTAAKVKQITLDELADLADKELADAQKNIDAREALIARYRIESEAQKLVREEEAALAEAERLQLSEERIQGIRNYFIQIRKDNADEAKAQQIADEEEVTTAQEEAGKKRAATAKKLADDEAKREDDLKKRRVKVAFDTASNIQTIVAAFGEKNKKAAKVAFNLQKGIDAAQAGISTFKAANEAYAALAGIPVVGPVLGGIAAGAAVAAGLINVRKILSAKFDEGGGATVPDAGGGGGGEAAAPTGSAQAIESVRPSNFSLFGTAGSANNMGSEQNVVQAVVLESDITSAQIRVGKFKQASEL